MGDYWYQDNQGRFRKGNDEEDFRVAVALIHHAAWIVVPIFGSIVMLAGGELFWFMCLCAIIVRLIMWGIGDYSHKRCTYIGLATVALSYIVEWWIPSTSDSVSPSFWIRLIWGLLL